MSNIATDVIVRVRMEFGAASETRRAAEAALAVQRAVETAQLTTLAKVRSAHKPAINDQIADVRKLEQAYTQMASRVVASFEQIRRAAGGGGGGLVPMPGGGRGGGGGGLIIPGAGGMIPGDPDRINQWWGGARGQRRLGGPGGGGVGGAGGEGGGGGGGGGLVRGPRIIEVEAVAREIKDGVEKGVESGMKAAGKAASKGGPGFFSGGDNKLLTITTATITALNAPRIILGGLTEGIKEIREGQFVENRFAGPGREFLGEVGGLIGDQDPMTRRMIQAMFGSVPGGGFMFNQMQGIAADVEQRKKPTAQQREKTFEDIQTKRLESEKQLNSILLERTKNERELIDETRARIKAAREEFGLMDVREKQATLDIARKVAAGGVGQLSSEELKFARQNVAFRGVLAEEAAKGADAAGFAEIVKLLGLDRKIAEAQAKIEADIKQTINVDLDPARLADALEERIAPLVKELEEITINRIRTQMNAQANEAARLRQQGVGI